jgi:benzylsuccinate CoA-transferase BbsE subunit
MSASLRDAPSMALSGIRVLDLSGPIGNYCGKLFADMGADVVLVEPPCGSSLRFHAPFVGDDPALEASLGFAYMNTSKRGITLDLDHPEGQDILRSLAATADLVIETEKPGLMAKRGLDHAALAQRRPSLVTTSITPFGQTGPYANYEADDLVTLALGGMLYLGGYHDGPPIAAYGNQAYAAASLFGALASMAAVYAAESTGTGDHIDVSAQESVVMAMENAAQFFELEGSVRKRYGGEQRQAGSGVYRCKDGYVVMLAGGIAANRFWKRTTQWLQDSGVANAGHLADPEWLDMKFLATPQAKSAFQDIFAPFAAAHTKAELYEAGRERQIPIAPVSTPAEILANRQLRHRGFFVDVWNDSARRDVTMPGAPYQFSATPWRISRPAPRLGEHNREILAEIGLDPADLQALKATGAI